MRSAGAAASAAGGVAAAFAAAACCGLPVLLAGAGVAASWLIPLAAIAAPYRIALSLVALAAIGLSLFIVLRRPRVCTPGALCARSGFRIGIVAAAALAAALLTLAWP